MLRKILVCVCLLALAPAFGTTTPNSFVTPQTPNRGIANFVQGSDSPGVYKVLYTAGANGSRCYAAWVANLDGVARQALLTLFSGSTPVGGVVIATVPVAGNTVGAPVQPLMTPTLWPGLPVDQYGNSYIQLVSGDTLKAAFNPSLSTSATMTFYVSCSDF